MLVGRVAGIIVVNEFATKGAAKGRDKIVGVPLMQSEPVGQLEGDQLHICPERCN